MIHLKIKVHGSAAGKSATPGGPGKGWPVCGSWPVES